MIRRLLACAFLALAGCAPPAEEPPPSTTTDSPATSSSSTSTTTSSEIEATVIHASFVAEEKAGDAPALLRLFNDTPDQILSLTLDDNQEYTFYEIAPLTASEYALTISDDMWTDAILSIHTNDTCVRKPFAEMTGPLSLEPGHAYGIHVTIDDGFKAAIEEEATPEPYVGVRVHVSDPAAGSTPAPSEIVLSMGGAPPGEIAYKTIFTEYPEPYTHVPGSKVEIQKIRFVDRAGVAHEASVPVVLEGSYGYTVHIDDEPQEAAEVDVPLDDLSE